jgi:hypothetical protein
LFPETRYSYTYFLLTSQCIPTHLAINGPGANPTIARYNASAVKFYNAGSSLVRFEKKEIFSFTMDNAPAFYNAGVVVVNSKFVGSAPDVKS